MQYESFSCCHVSFQHQVESQNHQQRERGSGWVQRGVKRPKRRSSPKELLLCCPDGFLYHAENRGYLLVWSTQGLPVDIGVEKPSYCLMLLLCDVPTKDSFTAS